VRRRPAPRDRHLKPHKVAGVREAIDAAGATRRYRPYSPDLNPIALRFAKRKAQLHTDAARDTGDRSGRC
jgi:hypothetical protein